MSRREIIERAAQAIESALREADLLGYYWDALELLKEDALMSLELTEKKEE